MTVINSRLAIGHTGITWADDDIEAGVKCIAGLGFHSIEIFAWVLKALHDRRTTDLFEKYRIPLVSAYFSAGIVEPGQRDAEMKKIAEWGDIAAGMGAKYATFGGNGVDRRTFIFEDHKRYIAGFVNEAAKRLRDRGLGLKFHPHTGTPVETEAEIRAFFDAVDTRYVGFAPDIGQIQKGGADPMKLIGDYVSLLGLVHLKDYSGRVEFDAEGRETDTTGYACYSPLGKGVVDIPGVLEFLEKSGFNGPVLVELDRGANMPLPAEVAVTINKRYLESLGYRFKTAPDGDVV
ncbi:MAG: sugar phosphate isomerase/epimerase [Treponema sp.]|jgi:inosose dehydratase|nr:sugar phosphate isomerase/epimerase [Treponema sp.]